jgi:hypothetical protein
VGAASFDAVCLACRGRACACSPTHLLVEKTATDSQQTRAAHEASPTLLDSTKRLHPLTPANAR